MRRKSCAVLAIFLLVSCAQRRKGDEIVVCGQKFHTGTPVVLWTDPGGYNAYLAPPGSHFSNRVESLPALQKTVDQFVIHYDACGLSRECFRVLNDERNLSVHFMLDIDGTIYQTIDLKEQAWHATTSNPRSIGIEIANIGAFDSPDAEAFGRWYTKDRDGRMRITIPAKYRDGGVRTKAFVGRPARNKMIEGQVQGQTLYQYDFTPEQYAALTKLTAALCKVFPNIKRDYPRANQKLPDTLLPNYRGVIGHYHIQTNKTDPGPAFQWDRVIDGAKTLSR
jgi:N-acetyl-anhydromuramyl-L-alanine amidase AmpD